MTTPPDPIEAEARRALIAWRLDDARLTPLAGGLINATFRIDAAGGRRAVLQRLHPVFDPAVNLNLERVTEVLAAQGLVTPRLLRTADARAWVTLEDRHWRLLSFVDGTSAEAVDSPARAQAAGALLGRFHLALATFVDALPCVRPPVHEPDRHFAALAAARARHPTHRLAAEVAPIAEDIAGLYATLPTIPVEPLRLVHGDPKISNLLFAPDGTGRCLLDLDTLARAPLAYELGDAFRSWCNPGAEDAAASSFAAALFEAALGGYATAGRRFMTAEERAAVVPATVAITLELSARFATDALEERYFGWTPARWPARGEHNLARARNQLAAARDLLTQRRALEALARRLLG